MIEEAIKYIPQVLLYIIPGFISIKIKEISNHQKKHDQFTYVLFCVLYSFISLILYKAFRYLTRIVPIPTLFDLLCKENVQICVCLGFGIIIGIVISKIPKLYISQLFRDFMNKNSSLDSVWESAIQDEDGVLARAYLRNGMIYEGELLEYTQDPDETLQVIVLFNYKIFITKNIIDEESPKEIKSETSNLFEEQIYKCPSDQDRVLIQRDDIISLHIYPGLEESLEEKAITILDEVFSSEEGKPFIVPSENWQDEAVALHYQPEKTSKHWINKKLSKLIRKSLITPEIEQPVYVLQLSKGLLVPSKVLAIVTIQEEDILVAAYAEEKLYRHKSAAKIVRKIEKAIPRKI